MPSTFGTSVTVTVFGQSHSAGVGCVIEGLPSGFAVDTGAIAAAMERRAPGRNAWSTSRKEADEVRILSGLNPSGRTCGAPLALMIANTDARSADYSNIVRTPRPGHADWVANVKWNGENDVAGGGHFSARLTAPLVAAGAICMQILEARGVRIAAHLAEVAGIPDERFSALDNSPEANAKLIAQFDALKGKEFPVLDEAAEQAMRAAIEGARAAGDSVGGIIECAAAGLPIGIGSPMFDGIENHLARALFGIPAVKGVEFGRGFEAARMRGSEHNDPYTVDAGGSVRVTTNNAGGVLGGITSGAPVVFRLVCKPTSSIALEQDSVDLTNGEPAKLVVSGRHDPCIAPRAVPVVEAVTAIALLDAWESFPADGFRA